MTEIETSRLIIRNLPKRITESKLRDNIKKTLGTRVTDVKIPKLAHDKHRQFAFIGLPSVDEARKAIKFLHNSYMESSKLHVSFAYATNSPHIPRPWSRYSVGSSAYELRHQKAEVRRLKKQDERKRKKVDESVPAETKKKRQRVKNAVIIQEAVIPTKAGVKPLREHILFEEDGNVEASALFDSASTHSSAGPNLPGRASDQRFHSCFENAATEGNTHEESPIKEEVSRHVWDLCGSTIGGANDKEPDANKPRLEDCDIPSAHVHGRIYVVNLPYTSTEQEVKQHFEQIGHVAQLHLCKGQSGSSFHAGRAFVTYAFAEDSEKALTFPEPIRIFQGRLLKLQAAHEKEATPKTPTMDQLLSKPWSKKTAQAKLKKRAEDVKTWNLCYVSANAALDATADLLSESKSELLGLDQVTSKNAESMASRVALTETYTIHRTLAWLESEGINAHCLERQGATLLDSVETEKQREFARADDTIIAKHLPASANLDEIRALFSEHGPLIRCTLSPTRTVAIIQYLVKNDAKTGFKRLAYTQYRGFPLFLEWAPINLFVPKDPAPALTAQESYGAKETLGHQEPESAPSTGSPTSPTERCLIYIKNLNFKTTKEQLEKIFMDCDGYLRASIATKKKCVAKDPHSAASDTDQTKELSLGYAFVEFESRDQVSKAINRFNNIVVDGHSLELHVSEPKRDLSSKANDAGVDAKAKKVLVRNLAFQASKKDLFDLFGAFGTVVSVRIPQKIDGTSRGYGFVEFLSSTEASQAMNALQHSHLYGRRLVGDFAGSVEVWCLSRHSALPSASMSSSLLTSVMSMSSDSGEGQRYLRKRAERVRRTRLKSSINWL